MPRTAQRNDSRKSHSDAAAAYAAYSRSRYAERRRRNDFDTMPLSSEYYFS